MKRGASLVIAVCIASSLSWYTCKQLFTLHTEQRSTLETLSILPAEIVKAASFEFKGITSDYIMLKTMTYLGQHLLARTTPTMDEWGNIYNLLKLVIRLDPLFWDPYVLVETMLIMQAGMVEQGNELLEQAAKIRTQDYRPYFLLWYNAFYLEGDINKAEQYMNKAIQRPNAPTYLAGVASRMSLQTGRLESSITLLTQLMNDTPNPTYREYLQKRIVALQMLGYLEIGVSKYKQKFNKLPKDLNELVQLQIIEKIPTDPYGGAFFLKKDGAVYTTSKLIQTDKKSVTTKKTEN